MLVLSPTTAQAKVVFNYCLRVDSTVCRCWVRRLPADHRWAEIRLHNGSQIIATHPNSFRSIRGPNADRMHLRRERVSGETRPAPFPDVECYRAVLPSISNLARDADRYFFAIPQDSACCTRSTEEKYYGVDDPDVLVVQGDSSHFQSHARRRLGSPRPRQTIRGPALAEWAGQFRADIAAFLSDADIDACVDRDQSNRIAAS